jgi:hypothetical protein
MKIVTSCLRTLGSQNVSSEVLGIVAYLRALLIAVIALGITLVVAVYLNRQGST